MADKHEKFKRKYISRANREDKAKNKFKKYIGNKAEGQGFADKRKKKIRYEYLKMLQKEKKKGHPVRSMIPEDLTDEEEGSETVSDRKTVLKPHGQKPEGGHAFSKAEWKQKKKKEEKQKKKQEALRKKREREQALNEYQINKKKNFKKICKKTRKGQPVMKNQMEYLLQKIEKQVNQT